MIGLKHIATQKRDAFFCSLDEQLNLLSPTNDCSFTCDVWTFKSSKHFAASIKIDFSIFKHQHLRFNDTFTIEIDNESIELSIVDYAKFIWLSICSNYSVTHVYLSWFEVLLLIFSFLKENEHTELNENNIKDFYMFSLTSDVSKEGVKLRLSSPVYYTRFNAFSIKKLLGVLQTKKCTPIAENVSTTREDKAFNEACLSVLGTTLSDYKQGSSFNFLGLDVGKHYIDHCANVIDARFQCAYALRSTLNSSLSSILEECKLNHNLTNKKDIVYIAGYSLMGEDIKRGNEKTAKNWPLNKKMAVAKIVYKYFCHNYNKYAKISEALKLRSVDEIISLCRLPDRYDTQEFVRSILFSNYVNDFGKSSASIFSEYIAVLRSEGVKFEYGFKDFISICEKVTESNKQTLSPSHACAYLNAQMKDLECNNVVGVKSVESYCFKVESAASTLFIGLTGWRASELGFSLSDVNAKANTEALDNLYIPWRFHVKWTVPKTSGTTPVNREITLQSYQLLYLSNLLNQSKEVQPCLYFPAPNAKKISDSTTFIQNRTGKLWGHFIRNYTLFADNAFLGNVSELLPESEVNEIIKLKVKLRESYPRYKLLVEEYKHFKDLLKDYVSGEMSDDNEKILDERLSNETKMKLRSGAYQLSSSEKLFIRSEVLLDDSYPTPHAFRHMWAEAVLRRYRGDIGKFIRANFKHLDESFFMAYLRGKETKAIYQIATRRFINGIVREQLMSLTDSSREYAGGFDRFLSKAVNLTKVLSQEEYEVLAEKISEERIFDAKSNAWGTCLLRKGSEDHAKCSDDGIPQRHNAQPKLCLPCSNINIAKGNYNGIVVYINQDVKACRNPNLPYFIKEMHLKIVRDALKRVRELKENTKQTKYDSYISHLVETILMAEQSEGQL